MIFDIHPVIKLVFEFGAIGYLIWILVKFLKDDDEEEK